MSETASLHWYVVQTQVNGENKAAKNLQRQGFKIYLPRYLKRRRHARKVDVIAKPLFPRYMFVAIDTTTQRWRSIQSTLGVSRLICVGDVPVAVHEGVVPALRDREDNEGFVRMGRGPTFAPGDKVRVIAGAFMDNAGLFNGMADHDRVSILLDMLGQKVRVLLDADMVAAA
jgi:transcriptional antiterminator RfaH